MKNKTITFRQYSGKCIVITSELTCSETNIEIHQSELLGSARSLYTLVSTPQPNAANTPLCWVIVPPIHPIFVFIINRLTPIPRWHSCSNIYCRY